MTQIVERARLCVLRVSLFYRLFGVVMSDLASAQNESCNHDYKALPRASLWKGDRTKHYQIV